jgi:FkbM family methyltransferase
VNVLNYLKRPEYAFRPRQILNRIRRIGKSVPATARVKLPWGATLEVRTGDTVGSEIFYFGVFDRIVPEAIYRLTDPGELTIEAGANIGQNSSLLAYKSGPKGKLIAFEPHPEIFQELKSNARLWSQQFDHNVQLENVALAETTGEAWLTNGVYFDRNRGTASLVKNDEGMTANGKHRVTVRRLDDFLSPGMKVGVCKIDVEGHELSVLKGAEESLSRGAIRDIIFEDFSPKPSAVVEFLQKHRFTVFQLSATWWKPQLTELAPGVRPPEGFTDNFLATLDPQRAKARFNPGGWRCLMCHPL